MSALPILISRGTIMTTTRTGVAELDTFTDQLDRIVTENTIEGAPQPRGIVTALQPHFEKLVSNVDWLNAHYFKPTREGDDTTHMLAKAPDDSWTIVSVVFPPGFSTPVHDHMIWGFVGVAQGVEDETRYVRHDDATIPGYAEVEFVGHARNLPGAIAPIVPNEDEIHMIHNPLGTNSVSIHVYGGDLDATWRHKFDPENKTVEDYISTFTVTC